MDIRTRANSNIVFSIHCVRNNSQERFVSSIYGNEMVLSKCTLNKHQLRDRAYSLMRYVRPPCLLSPPTVGEVRGGHTRNTGGVSVRQAPEGRVPHCSSGKTCRRWGSRLHVGHDFFLAATSAFCFRCCSCATHELQHVQACMLQLT